MTRAEAARLEGIVRQALRDAVIRYNAEAHWAKRVHPASLSRIVLYGGLGSRGRRRGRPIQALLQPRQRRSKRVFSDFTPAMTT
jgi:hypothetical protein